MNGAGAIAVRILREWRGHPVGAIIRPPGAVRQILLESKDETGKPFAELVKDQIPAGALFAKDADHRSFEQKRKKERR